MDNSLSLHWSLFLDRRLWFFRVNVSISIDLVKLHTSFLDRSSFSNFLSWLFLNQGFPPLIISPIHQLRFWVLLVHLNLKSLFLLRLQTFSTRGRPFDFEWFPNIDYLKRRYIRPRIKFSSQNATLTRVENCFHKVLANQEKVLFS